MPIYDARLNDRLGIATIMTGSEPFPRFDGKVGQLLDANGNLIDLLLLRCDTETGMVEYYPRTATGQFLLDPVTRRVITAEQHFPAPLSYGPVKWFRKCAGHGKVVRYPSGETNVGTAENPVMRDNQDFAKRIAAYSESNAVIVLDRRMIEGAGIPKEVIDGSDCPPDEPFIVGK